MGNLITTEAKLMEALANATNDSPSVCGEPMDKDDDWLDISDEEEVDFEERLQILKDCQQLKQLAVAFLHPELPVEVDPTATARCYFDRFSAPEQESKEEMDERDAVLEDAARLKQLAVDHMHPELPVVNSVELNPSEKFYTVGSVSSRCYFDRFSAPVQETEEEMDEHTAIMEDLAKLRQLARQYLHPEDKVVGNDSTATARCYFDRFSAPQQESQEEAEERMRILEDAAALKQLAVDYMHPELPVSINDTSATARCYFDRYSAYSLENKAMPVGKLLEANIPSEEKNLARNAIRSKTAELARGFRNASNANSASAVNLYGLDDDAADSSSF